jgi:hypothetical protein
LVDKDRAMGRISDIFDNVSAQILLIFVAAGILAFIQTNGEILSMEFWSYTWSRYSTSLNSPMTILTILITFGLLVVKKVGALTKDMIRITFLIIAVAIALHFLTSFNAYMLFGY